MSDWTLYQWLILVLLVFMAACLYGIVVALDKLIYRVRRIEDELESQD